MTILHYSDKASTDICSLYNSCDVLLTTGDLSLYDLLPIEGIDAKKPSFGVYGNHDSGNYMERFGIINLHNQIYQLNGLTWGGFQGCLKYKENAITYTEDEAKHFADTFPYVDVLLLHAGPRGMLDDSTDVVHLGSEHVRRYVLEKKPRFVFLGHQYSDDYLEVGATKLYRTFGARLIEI